MYLPYKTTLLLWWIFLVILLAQFAQILNKEAVSIIKIGLVSHVWCVLFADPTWEEGVRWLSVDSSGFIKLYSLLHTYCGRPW